MTDFRNIDTQEDIEALFQKTSLKHSKGFEGLTIDAPIVEEENYQHIHVTECSHMGSLVSVDRENCGEDALFVQTLVKMFKDGRLKLEEFWDH